MSDNVVKFRRIEKKPEPPKPKKPGVPRWVPWLGLVVVAIAIYVVRQAGWLGG